MDKEIIEKVRQFVEEECKKPTSKYGHDLYSYHIFPVVQISKHLANLLNVDREVVELAAWLHDIGSIINGREDHHITGAKIAEQKLRGFGYPEEKIRRVVLCVLSHRGSKSIKQQSVEEKIIAEADAIDAFDRLSGLFEAAYVFENKSREEARDSVKNKLINKWNQLTLEESKRIVKPKYEAAMLLLK